MTDHLERLRSRDEHTAQWAVGEIERNRAAIAELVGALKAIVDLDDGDKPDLWHFEAEFNAARAAITKHQQPTTTKEDK